MEKEIDPSNKDAREPAPGLRVRHSPATLMAGFVLITLLAEGADFLLFLHIQSESLTGKVVVEAWEVAIIIFATYFLLYRPLKRQWEARERGERVIREGAAALRKSEERQRLALEGTSSGLWDWDFTTGKAYYSPGGERILGYVPGELESTIAVWEDLIHQEDRPEVLKALMNHLEGRTPIYETDHRLRSKSGAWVWFHAMGQVIARDAEGSPLRMVGTFHDATARKEYEEQIHLLSWQLIHSGEEERRNISRDLHDQAGHLLTMMQLGMRILKVSLSESRQIDQCQELIDMTTRMGELIRNVSARIRPPALDMGLVPALEYDLDRVREHVSETRISLHAPGMEFERLDPRIEITLFRIYQEALNNALKHAWARTIGIRLQREGSEVVLEVQDNGVGFEFPVAGSEGKRQRGIGLVGMRERVAALGGRLEIVSRPGEGTSVTAYLPRRLEELKEESWAESAS